MTEEERARHERARIWLLGLAEEHEGLSRNPAQDPDRRARHTDMAEHYRRLAAQHQLEEPVPA